MTPVSMISAITLIIRRYRNWPSMIVPLIGNRPIHLMVTREGHYLRGAFDRKSAFYLGCLLEARWRVSRIEDQSVLLISPNQLRFACRLYCNDFGALVETFITEPYAVDVKGKVVVDVGANIGDTAIYFASKGARRVIAIEPDPDSLECARRNVSLNRLEDRIELSNEALASQSGSRTLHVSQENRGSNSMLESLDFRFDRDIEVSTTTIESVISRYGIESIDLLKMDCEGCEQEVIPSLKLSTTERIKEFVFEFHKGFKDNPRVEDFLAIIERDGFVVSRPYPDLYICSRQMKVDGVD